MHFQSRASTTSVHEILFADDCALNTTSEKDMQRSMGLSSAVCKNFGLINNTQKTVVVHQPPPKSATPTNAPQINVNGTQLQVVENFLYLRSSLSRNTKIDDEVANRISKATNSDSSSEPPLPSSSSSFSTTISTTAAQAAVSHITNPDTKTDTTPTSSDSSDEDRDYTCPHRDRTFTLHIGLVGHLRIHRTETAEPVPGVPTYTHRSRVHCPHCPRTFTHRMGVFGYMRIHDDLR
ncbi:hypothetical protein SprV_0702454600 [Sparganum proliferum]